MSKELPEIQWKWSVERYRVSGIRCDWKGRQWSVIHSPDLKPGYKLYNFLPHMIFFSQNFKPVKDSLFTNCLIQYDTHKVCV